MKCRRARSRSWPEVEAEPKRKPRLSDERLKDASLRRTMRNRYLLGAGLSVALFLSAAIRTSAQDGQAQIRVNVNLVQLNVAVTDHDGKYITGLKPEDFVVSEDKIPQKIATFEEGSERTPTAEDSPAEE